MRFGRCSPKVIVGVSKFWPQNSKVVGVFTDVEDGVVESVVDSWVTADSSATAWQQQFHQSGDKLDLFGHSFESVYSKFIVVCCRQLLWQTHLTLWSILPLAIFVTLLKKSIIIVILCCSCWWTKQCRITIDLGLLCWVSGDPLGPSMIINKQSTIRMNWTNLSQN